MLTREEAHDLWRVVWRLLAIMVSIIVLATLTAYTLN